MTEQTPLSVHEPETEPPAGIVVVQEAFGVNDHIEDVGRRFAAHGWLAVVPHFFHRSGDPDIGYDDIPAAREHMSQLTPEGILEDVDAAIQAHSDAGIAAGNVGVVGFCMGGTIALVTAARRTVGAAVTFYGGGVTEGRFGFDPLEDEATRLEAPWLGLFGDLDASIPVADVERLRAAAASSGQPTEIVRYPDAGHGFHCDERDSYHEPSARDAWQRTLDWFEHHLAGG